MHNNALHLFEYYALDFFKESGKVLELGPDKAFTIRGMLSPDVVYQCADPYMDSNSPEVIPMTEYAIEAPDGEFDVVVSSNVIEHVRFIWVWMQELARVTKKGGYVITGAPVSWRHHNVPIDCWRIYDEGLKALYEYAGLKPIVVETKSMVGSKVVDTIGVALKVT